MSLVRYILPAISDAELQVAAFNGQIHKHYPELRPALEAKYLDTIDRDTIRHVLQMEGFNCVKVDMFRRIMERTAYTPSDNCIPVV